MISAELDATYDNIVLIQVTKVMDHLLQRGSETHVNSIVLTQGWIDHPRLMELKGLGKSLWRGEDAQQYIDRLREQWRK